RAMVDRQSEQFDEEFHYTQEPAAESTPGGGAIGGREDSDRDESRRDEPAATASGTSTLEELAQGVRRRLASPSHLPRTVREEEAARRVHLNARQRLLILDTWVRSKLPAREFADLFALSPHTLYAWKKRFEQEGPAGLEDSQRGAPRGSRLSEAAKRAILLMKSQHPEWGQDRLHAMLLRSEGLSASPGAIERVLLENGYSVVSEPTQPHEPKEDKYYSG